MAREIIIDSDTLIGYDFPNKTFYITNKGTTTDRLSKSEAFKVLKVVAGNNPVDKDGVAITEDRLEQELVIAKETLTNLYYTWEDTGSYIKTIQLNTWDKYPLTLDAEKKKLYIMNSEIIYDLSTNEGSSHRVLYIQSFYENQLGLYVSTTDLEILYNLLYSFYMPKTYNKFKAREVDSMTGEYLPLQYSNTIILPNFSGKSKATYTLTLNPQNKYTPDELADIINMYSNKITLTNSAPSDLTTGSILKTTNTDIDGTYTITEIEDNVLTVDKEFQTEYTCPTPNLYIRAYNTYIDEMSTEDNTITLKDNVPDEILIGDKIRLVNTSITTTYETISLDGEYTVTNKHNKTITVAEQIATNYNHADTGSTQGIMYKPIILGNVLRVTTTSPYQIVLAHAPLHTISVNENVAIQYNSGDVLYGQATAVDTSTNTVTVNFTLTNFQTGKLIKQVPYPEVLISVQTTTNSETLPTGSFEVDSTDQCTDYLGLLTGLVTPSTDSYFNAGMYASTEYTLDTPMTDLNETIETMELKGLYSEVYGDSI